MYLESKLPAVLLYQYSRWTCGLECTLTVFYWMITIIPSKVFVIISIIWHTFTRKTRILMAKCWSFFDIFKVVVVVIDGSDYLHQDNIPQLSHFSYLLMDSASSIQTPLLLLQLFIENLLCLILLKCYSPFLSKSLVQCMINGTTNYCLYDKKNVIHYDPEWHTVCTKTWEKTTTS